MARSSAVSSATDRSVFVVGAGVAGCVIAATALELGYAVTVFEAGSGGPLPPELRSADLNRASEARAWWSPGDYLAGRGVGGGSAVNGMVLQRPTDFDGAAQWAWNELAPTPAAPGSLGQRLLAVDPHAVKSEILVRDGSRWTAANQWLQPHERLMVKTGRTIDGEEVRRWRNAGHTVILAAGVFGSPSVLGIRPNAALDHRSAVLEFSVPEELQFGAVDRSVATVLIRWGDCQGLLLERAGPDSGGGAFIVSAMTADADLDDGVARGIEYLRSVGLDPALSSQPAPVAHACCTLTGVDTIVPVIDAATLFGLPAVNPMVTVAAHARRESLRLLDHRT